MKRLIISGTREPLSAEDRAAVADLVMRGARWADEVGVGDCPTGVDALVRELVPDAVVFVARWRELGRRAGPERNGRLVAWAAEAELRWLLAFPGPRSTGTPDCVQQAEDAGVPVVVTEVGHG